MPVQFYLFTRPDKQGTYSVTTDVDWLTVSNATTSGSATVTINASKGTTKERTGHVIVSESVTYKGTTITLQNKNFKGMTIVIYPIAFLVIYPRKLL